MPLCILNTITNIRGVHMNTNDFLQEKIKKIPELPGIYKMLDARMHIIYIGKSKCLRKRVRSYFVNSPKWEKINQMVTMIKDIEYIVTDTHLEARLLECKLIKELKPWFNAQMKNDRRYIYIKVEKDNPSRSLSVVQERDTDCFGPFRGKFYLEELAGRLKNIFPLSKRDEDYEFEYHIFPVTMDQAAYQENRRLLIEILSEEENISEFIKTLQRKLEEAADQYRYELASVYRDFIPVFTQIKNSLKRYKNLSARSILLKLPIPEGYKLLFISNAHIINVKNTPLLTDEIIREFKEASSVILASLQPEFDSEKSAIDFRDILYSELSDLSEDMYEILV